MKALLFTLILLTTSLLLPPVTAGPLRDKIDEFRHQHVSGPANSTQSAPTYRDMAYGPHPKERYDIYLPTVPNTTPYPVIFMVHGGAWRIGDKAHDRVVDNKVAYWRPQGVAVISVNYPMLPDTPPLAQAEAIARALSHAQQHAQSWGLDAQRFVLMGHSAGAHLIALINAQPTLALQHGARPWLGAIALDSAAMNLPQIMKARHFPFYDEAFGQDPEVWRKASPALHITPESRPILLVCSSRRPDACQQARTYEAAARRLGVFAETFPIDLSHGEINEQIGLSGPLTAKIRLFLQSLHPSLSR